MNLEIATDGWKQQSAINVSAVVNGIKETIRDLEDTLSAYGGEDIPTVSQYRIIGSLKSILTKLEKP